MTAVFTPVSYEPLGEVLTAEQYDALPENSLRELVDGVIRIMATPNGRHQFIARELCSTLDRLGRPRFRAIEAIEVRLGNIHRRNPDVVVVPAAAYDAEHSYYRPHEVVLAAEVVSPGSEIADRREKPVEYAVGGIPFYWRIEPAPELVVHAFRLGSNGYLSAGEFRPGQTVLLDGLEWAAVPVSDLVD